MMTDRERAIAIRMLEYCKKHCNQVIPNVKPDSPFFWDEAYESGLTDGVAFCVYAIDCMIDEENVDLDDLVKDITEE